MDSIDACQECEFVSGMGFPTDAGSMEIYSTDNVFWHTWPKTPEKHNADEFVEQLTFSSLDRIR